MNRLRYFAVTTAICLGTFMATLDISIVNVALPAIQHDLDAPMVSFCLLYTSDAADERG